MRIEIAELNNNICEFIIWEDDRSCIYCSSILSLGEAQDIVDNLKEAVFKIEKYMSQYRKPIKWEIGEVINEC